MQFTSFTSTKVQILTQQLHLSQTALQLELGAGGARGKATAGVVHMYMCPHTTTCVYVSSYYYMCPDTAIYVSSYYYICIHVSSYYYICIYVSSYYYVFLILLL
jgi:hypothetical protein